MCGRVIAVEAPDLGHSWRADSADSVYVLPIRRG